jgi:alpha-beta hydrolase superfamily lysophospholipase
MHMADTNEINQKIITVTGGIYRAWTIGTTNDPDQAKKAQRNPKNWNLYEADSAADAKAIVDSFVEQKMVAGPSNDGASTVYLHLNRR